MASPRPSLKATLTDFPTSRHDDVASMDFFNLVFYLHIDKTLKEWA